MNDNFQIIKSKTDLILIISVLFWVSGIFFGFFLTSFPELTVNNWFWWLGARIVWQLGGSIWFCSAVCNPLGENKFKGAITGSVIGLALCFNPLLDIFNGPQKIKGKITGVHEFNEKIWRKNGAYSNSIHSRIYIETDEKKYKLKLSGRQANLWSDKFLKCKKSKMPVNAIFLRNTDTVLEINCQP